jgi:hypothetical protein
MPAVRREATRQSTNQTLIPATARGRLANVGRKTRHDLPAFPQFLILLANSPPGLCDGIGGAPPPASATTPAASYCSYARADVPVLGQGGGVTHGWAGRRGKQRWASTGGRRSGERPIDGYEHPARRPDGGDGAAAAAMSNQARTLTRSSVRGSLCRRAANTLPTCGSREVRSRSAPPGNRASASASTAGRAPNATVHRSTPHPARREREHRRQRPRARASRG